MNPKLLAEEGLLKGLEFSLQDGEEWTLGRDPEFCQLIIEDPSVSRKQLLLSKTPAGISAENLSNTTPVYINQQELTESTILHQGDVLKIGNTSFYYYTEEGAQINNNNDFASKATPKHLQSNGNPFDHEDYEEDTIFEDEESGSLAQIDFDLTKSSRWLLKVLSGPHGGAEFSMQSGTTYIIGTDPFQCDIVFHDASVSRQHARITVGNGDTVDIEDLNSRNNTIVDGEAITSKKTITSNSIITVGTTTFVVFDREGQRETIVSPMLPSIVKVLQKEEERKEEAKEKLALEKGPEIPPEPTPEMLKLEQEKSAEEERIRKEKLKHRIFNIAGTGILIIMGLGLLSVIVIGVKALFKEEEVVRPMVDETKEIEAALASFPTITYSFNKQTGNLLLVGHVLTKVDHAQLMYNLQGMSFLKNINDNIIIDELIWQEMNQILSKNPNWRVITIQAPKPGHFVITGYLQTKKQAEELSDYLSLHFPYPDLLEKKVVVEEDVISQIQQALQDNGFHRIETKIFDGEVSLKGGIPFESSSDFETVLNTIKNIPGVRSIRNYVVEQAPEQSIINLSDRYEVTGFSHHGGLNISVIINGKILSQGDTLDGMTITSIKPNAIYLEKDGVKYRIDFNK